MLRKRLVQASVLTAALLGAYVLPVAVPQAAAEVPVQTVLVTAEGIEVPEGITPGLTTLTIDNTAQAEAPAVVLVARLNDEVTQESFMEGMAGGDPMALFTMVNSKGGTMVMPGSTLDITTTLEAGTYVIADFAREIPAMSFFEVAAPEAEFTVDLVDFAFVMPSELSAGEHVVEITNSGAEPHEFIVMQILDENITEDEIVEALLSEEGDERLQEAFIWIPMSAGNSAHVTMNLPAGRYVAACFVQYGDHTHLHEGMIAYFTVTE